MNPVAAVLVARHAAQDRHDNLRLHAVERICDIVYDTQSAMHRLVHRRCSAVVDVGVRDAVIRGVGEFVHDSLISLAPDENEAE